jgi:hypothetical protein
VFLMIEAKTPIASAVWTRARSRTSKRTFGRSPGLPDRPFCQAVRGSRRRITTLARVTSSTLNGALAEGINGVRTIQGMGREAVGQCPR